MNRKHLLGLSRSGFHKVSYMDWGAADATRVVICAHGLTRNARDFDAVARALAARCRVICPDVVGRGQSDWLANKEDYGYPQYLADMTALIARATERLADGTQLDWVGTSMGGLIGMMLAAQQDSPIRRLIINDVGPVLPRAALQRIAMYVGKAPRFASLAEAERYVRTVSAPFGPLSDDEWAHLTTHNVKQGSDGRFEMNYDPGISVALQNIPPDDITLWDVWDRIRCPVLVLRGMQSDLLAKDTAQEMTARGPRAQLVEFDGIGHAPALLAQDQIDAIVAFLAADTN
jgi:pimeloyl-ACP methyl ester carboxylesterase